MTIGEIIVHTHQRKLDNHEVYSRQIRDAISQHFTLLNVEKIDIYPMDGEINTPVLAGTSHRLVMLLNYPLEYDGATEIRHPETGELLATHLETQGLYNQINIFPDLFSTHGMDNLSAFIDILKLIHTQIYYQRELDYSWKSTSKKEELTREFTTAITQQQERYIREDKERVENAEREIRDYTQHLKTLYDKRIRFLNQIESAQIKLDGVGEKLIRDLDNIVAHPKVKELFIRDGKFVVHTEPLYMYHDISGDRYYLGNMKIEMNPQNTQVKFFGDNPRKSYWSGTDPHPHVDGRRGNACLGNVAPTIAELCSQMELYALTMIAIDFLESVNTSDPAGKNIINWDRVDDEGNIIEPVEVEEEFDWHCDFCEEGHHDHDESVRVYNSYTGSRDGEGEYGREMYVCETCQENHYTWHECLDEYVRDGECNFTDNEEDDELEF